MGSSEHLATNSGCGPGWRGAATWTIPTKTRQYQDLLKCARRCLVSKTMSNLGSSESMRAHALPPYLMRHIPCTNSLQWLLASDSSSSASATKSGLEGSDKILRLGDVPKKRLGSKSWQFPCGLRCRLSHPHWAAYGFDKKVKVCIG